MNSDPINPRTCDSSYYYQISERKEEDIIMSLWKNRIVKVLPIDQEFGISEGSQEIYE